MIVAALERVLNYGETHGLFVKADRPYIRNRVIDVLGLEQYELRSEESFDWEQESLLEAAGIDYILKPLLDDAVARGRVPEDTLTYRDLLDSAVMGALLDRPSAIVQRFESFYANDIQQATNDFYAMNQAVNYIRQSRNEKNLVWQTPSEFGALDITVNLSKPEKDPKEILAEKLAVKSNYPQCLLCRENEGYMGRVNHPARQNLRVLPVKLAEESWYFQYSPYTYYNEHCIVLSEEHVPMVISRQTFQRLLDFVKWLPHYFVGSNADLPIVGGSILSHDHFQGGRYEFPMDRAAVTKTFRRSDLPQVTAEFLNWPLSVLRIKGPRAEQLVDLAEQTLECWKTYSDVSNEILSHTNGERHNTITPVARFKNGIFELDLVLRNNRTSDEHPEGIFHPHQEIHSIKKENIGLIEVMGLAVLPGRLKTEMNCMIQKLMGTSLSTDEEALIEKHSDLMAEITSDPLFRTVSHSYEALQDMILHGVGQRFTQGLVHAGVFKQTPEGVEGMIRFANHLGWEVAE